MLLVTDGQVHDEVNLLYSASKNAGCTRVFSLGVGASPSRHFIRSLARVAGGSSEIFDRKRKSGWEKRVKAQIARAQQPALSAVSVHWHQVRVII